MWRAQHESDSLLRPECRAPAQNGRELLLQRLVKDLHPEAQRVLDASIIPPRGGCEQALHVEQAAHRQQEGEKLEEDGGVCQRHGTGHQPLPTLNVFLQDRKQAGQLLLCLCNLGFASVPCVIRLLRTALYTLPGCSLQHAPLELTRESEGGSYSAELQSPVHPHLNLCPQHTVRAVQNRIQRRSVCQVLADCSCLQEHLPARGLQHWILQQTWS